MIEAKELRIGNWLRDDVVNLRDVQVEYVDPSEDFSMLSPIPLTDDWLDRFGFSDRKIDLRVLNNVVLICDVYDDGEYCFVANEYLDIRIDWVHQLQNLYYALTGGELELLKD